MASRTALAVGLLSAMRADQQLARLAGEFRGQAALVGYVAHDVQLLKEERALERHGRDSDTEARLDHAEQAALVLAAEVRRLADENVELWAAIRNLARRIERG